MSESDVLRLISGWQRGDEKARNMLLELSYLKIKELAQSSFSNLPKDVNTAFLSMSVTELAHDTYEKLHRAEPSLSIETIRQYYSYLHSSVRNLFVDHYRKHVKTRGGAVDKTPLHDTELQATPAPSNFANETQLELHLHIDQFAQQYPRQAEALELRYFARKNNKQVAALMAVSVRTVENDIRFAKAWLKSRLN